MSTKIGTIREVIVNYKTTATGRFAIRDKESVVEFVRSILPDNSREHFVTLYLDGNHTVCDYAVISTGSANSSIVHPREVLQRAVLVGAVSIVVAHNHPSGNLGASKEDANTTTRLNESCKILGIKLLDHIIVTDSDSYSFRDSQPDLFYKGRYDN